MNCEECNVDLLALAYGELGPAEASAARARLEGCPACQAELDRLEGLRRLLGPWSEEQYSPSAASDAAIMQVAQAKIGAVTSPERATDPSLWARAMEWLASAALGPQTAMATIMLLAIGIGLYYFPRTHEHEAAATGGTVTEIPDGTGLGFSVTSREADEERSAAVAPLEETVVPPAEPAAAPSEVGRSSAATGTAGFGGIGAAQGTLDDPPPRPAPTPARSARARRRSRGGAGARPDLSAAPEETADGFGESRAEPSGPSALRQLADADRRAGRCNRALSRYESLLRAYPRYSEAEGIEVDAAECYRRVGRVAEARRALERATRSPAARPRAQRALMHLERQVAAEAQPAAAPAGAADTAASEAAY